MQLPIKKLVPEAKLPTYAHDTDAGMDLYALETVTILAGARGLIKTGIAVAIPAGYVGLFWDKSGLSNKSGLKVIGGVIDADYRGELLVGLLNTSEIDFTFEMGQKVAQMLIQKVEHPELILVEELDETARGNGAFGSTGL
jgi:dUTP pyrophosphatase